MLIAGIVLVVAVVVVLLRVSWRASVFSVQGRRVVILAPIAVLGLFSIRNYSLATFVFWPMVGEHYSVYPTLVVSTALASLIVGYVLGSRITIASARDFVVRPLTTDYSEIAYFAGLILASSALVASGVWLYGGMPDTWASITDLATTGDTASAADISASRKSITKGHVFGARYRGQGLNKVLQNVGWTLVSGLCVSGLALWRNKKWRLATAFTFIAGIIFIGGTSARAPVALFLLFHVILLSYLRPLSFKRVTLGFVGIIAVIAVLTVLSAKVVNEFWNASSGAEAVAQTAEKLLRRIAYGNGFNDIHVMRFIEGRQLPIGHGEYHMRSAINALPGVSEPPLEHTVGQLLGGPDHAFENGTYLMYAYADFGLLGASAAFFAHGILFGVLQSMVFRMRRELLTVPLAAWTACILPGMFNASGIISLLSSVVVATVVLGLILVPAYIVQKGLTR